MSSTYGGSFGVNTPLDDLAAREAAADEVPSWTDDDLDPALAVRDLLLSALEDVADDDVAVSSVCSFREAGVLSGNAGVVVDAVMLATGRRVSVQVTLVNA